VKDYLQHVNIGRNRICSVLAEDVMDLKNLATLGLFDNPLVLITDKPRHLGSLNLINTYLLCCEDMV
jgi:hypothetical protein